MRVAVVGAGVSGLAAVKCCRDEGLDVVCFERRNDLGGLWNYTENVEPGQSNVARFVILLLFCAMTAAVKRTLLGHACPNFEDSIGRCLNMVACMCFLGV